MTECRRQRCDREAERASLADGQCIRHAQMSLTDQRNSAGRSEPVEEPESNDSE